MRTSPTGPIPSTGASWSSMFIACIATVRPIPSVMRLRRNWLAVAFPRVTPPLSV